MAQFASSLYPQTNPSNQILLEFRAHAESSDADVGRIAVNFLDLWEHLLATKFAPPSQRQHARKVIARLASLTG